MADFHDQNMENLLIARLEAILFVAPGPVTVSQIAESLGEKQQNIELALEELARTFQKNRGLMIIREKNRIQLASSPLFAMDIERFLGLEATARLSRAALETLAIIAYKQPITRPAIEAIRGVNSDGVLKSLLSKNLIEVVGRAEGPGRPILFGTTSDFLQNFGLSSIEDLPPFDTEDNLINNGMEVLKD